MITNEPTYCYAFQRLNIGTKRKNEILQSMSNEGITIDNLFELDNEGLSEKLELSNIEMNTLSQVKDNLTNISFLTEDIIDQGFEIISILDKNYPDKYKNKLKQNAPPVLFVKGNLEILKQGAISIIGSRNASNTSLEFTQNISKTAARSNRTVVSGGAKGVDSFAAHSAISNGGTTVIVLAEGVRKFKGYREHYKAMTEGRLLIISSFDPDDRWQTFKAQERNPLIYALGDKVFIAESGEKGGTMNGALHALKQHWEVFIRYPHSKEVNANMLLIHKGCIPVNMKGKPLELDLPKSELEIEKEVIAGLEKILKGKQLTISELIKALDIDWKGTKLSGLIKRLDNIIPIGGKPAKYTFKDSSAKDYKQGELF